MFDGGVLSKGLRGGSSSTRNWLKATKELARGRAGPRPGGRGRARDAEGEGQGERTSKNRGADGRVGGAGPPAAKRPFAKNEVWTRCGRRQLSSWQVAFNVLKVVFLCTKKSPSPAKQVVQRKTTFSTLKANTSEKRTSNGHFSSLETNPVRGRRV